MVRGRLPAIVLLATTGCGFGSLVLAADAPQPAVPPASEAMVELGRRLFFDPAASRTGMRSCADCHDPNHGWSDPAEHSEDARGLTRRHSQTLIDCFASPRAHWDGEFASIEDLVKARIAAKQPPPPPPPGTIVCGPFVSPYLQPPMLLRGEDAPPSGPREPPARPTTFVRGDVADWDFPTPDRGLETGGRYSGAFRAAFGTPAVTVDRMVTALGAFCRSIRSGESPYDRYAAGDGSALTPAAVRGFTLFVGEGRCAKCHHIQPGRSLFTDGGFHNTGVESRHFAKRALGDWPPQFADPGSAGRPNGRVRGFKTPPLRDVSRRGPYMHDGSLLTLGAVVRHYLVYAASEARLASEPRLDRHLPTHRANATDIDDLVAFLRALTSDERPGKAPEGAPFRASHTRLRFLDANGEPLADRAVTLEPAGDELPGADTSWITLTTDAAGRVEFVPPRTTHVRIRLEPGLRPLVGGAWIPDSCAEADIRLPLRGVGRMDVRFPAGERPPAAIVLHGEGGTVFPDRVVPTMTLRLTGSQPSDDGVVLGRYAGAVRSDLLGVGRWFLGGLKTKAPSVLVVLDRFHTETVDLTR